MRSRVMQDLVVVLTLVLCSACSESPERSAGTSANAPCFAATLHRQSGRRCPWRLPLRLLLDGKIQRAACGYLEGLGFPTDRYSAMGDRWTCQGDLHGTWAIARSAERDQLHA